MQETSALLRARRVEAGAITSDNKLKVSFTLDERGNAVDVDRYPRVDSNVLVEEVSCRLPCMSDRADDAVHVAGKHVGCAHHREWVARAGVVAATRTSH